MLAVPLAKGLGVTVGFAPVVRRWRYGAAPEDRHDPPEDDFDHPSLPDGSPLRRHVLYRVTETSYPSG
jgi:hypothetical protein